MRALEREPEQRWQTAREMRAALEAYVTESGNFVRQEEIASLVKGMFAAQRALFPNDAHIEWPGPTPRNPWVRAFEWIHTNTPREAVFALDPNYMKLRGEDEQGFRAIAQRSRLADNRDSGAVSMFPALADEWFRQVQAQSGWGEFHLQDFRRLQVQYGVTWLVLQPPEISGLDCPYHNGAVLVCDLPQ